MLKDVLEQIRVINLEERLRTNHPAEYAWLVKTIKEPRYEDLLQLVKEVEDGRLSATD